MKSKELENEIRRFLTDRALPIIMNPKSGDTVHLMSKRSEENYYVYLDKIFNGITVWDKKVKHCKCVEEIIKQKEMTRLQLMIFIVKHDINFSKCTHYYDGHNGPEDSCFLMLDSKNHIDIDFCTHEDLLRGNTQLRSIVKSAFDYLKGEYCKKYYERSNWNPDWVSFNDKYWKLQAELFYKGLPALSNKGCHGRKVGITPDEECKDCKYFAFLEFFHHCDFDYWEVYEEHHCILLPDDGKTYACDHFKRTESKKNSHTSIEGK